MNVFVLCITAGWPTAYVLAQDIHEAVARASLVLSQWHGAHDHFVVTVFGMLRADFEVGTNRYSLIRLSPLESSCRAPAPEVPADER